MGVVAAMSGDPASALLDGRARAQDPDAVVVRSTGELSMTLLDAPHRGTPIELRLEAETVVLPENRLGWQDVVDPQASQPRIRASFVAPDEPGEYVVRGRVSYITCGPKRCRSRVASVSWIVRVTDPGTTDGP
jgi:hypothetical protein